MMHRTFLSLTASILAASSSLAGCDPGDDPDDSGDGSGGGTNCDRWYPDADGDNHGDANEDGVTSCTAVANHVRNNDDCDDTSQYVHPDQGELCDGIDNDCNEEIEPTGSCPTGCRAIPSNSGPGLYMFCGTANWATASEGCIDQGMHLVHVNDDEENDWVIEMTKSLFPSAGQVYFGGNDQATEGAWIWTDNNQRFWTGGPIGSGGMPVSGVYRNWSVNEPNNSSGGIPEHCLAGILTGTLTYLWNDVPCNFTYPFVCERS